MHVFRYFFHHQCTNFDNVWTAIGLELPRFEHPLVMHQLCLKGWPEQNLLKELEPIARGPQNTGKRFKHAKTKPKACLETLNLLRTPSNRGVAYPMDNVVDIARADSEPPVADGNLRAEAATDSLPVKSEGVAPVEYSGINCMARVWGGGQGGQ